MNIPSVNSNSEYLSANLYGDPQRVTNIFIRFITVILLGFVAGIIFNISKGNYFVVVLDGVCVVPVLVTLLLVRRKRFEAAATILAFILINLVTIVVTNGQGIRQVGVLAYPAILIISSLVVRKRTMALLTLYNIVCVAWLMLGEYFGIFTPALPARSTPAEFFIVAIILGLTAYMVRLLTEALFKNNLLLQKELKERKETETALRESELNFRSIFDNSLDAIGVSKAGIHVMANPAYLRMFGYESTEQLVGKSILDLIAPPHRPQILDYVQRRAAGEHIPTNYETHGLRRDGTEFDMDVRVSTYELGGELYTVPILRDITQRKQMEDALRDSEIRYRTIVESTTDLICRFLPDTTLTFVNTAYCQYFGKDSRELVGMRFLEMIPREGWGAVQEQVNSIIFKQEPYTYEHEVVSPTGEIRWQQWTDSPILNDSGQVVELQSVGRDITERKIAEKALQESERRFREMLQGVELAGVMLNKAGRITFINDFLLHITGWSREEALGESWFDKFLPEELREGVRSAFGRLMAGEQAMPHYENEILTRRAERRLIRWNNTLLFDPNGNAIGTASIGEDITERKRVENALKDSQRRLSTALRATKVGVWEWDMRTNKAYWSDENYRVLGLEPRSVESRYENWAKCLHPDDLPVAEARVAEAVNSRGTLNIEFRVIWPDGGIHWVNDIGELLVDQDTGQPLGMYGIQMDVTERKHAEVEREKLIYELESKNIESEILRESAAAVAYPLEFNETVSRILDQLKRAVPYDSASIHLLLGNEVELIGGRGFPEGKDPLGMRFVLDESDPAYPILRDGLPYILYPNVQLVSDRFKGFFHEHIFSWMAIPLYARGRLIGMIAADGFSIDKFTEEHARFALTFANQVAVTLENARLFEQLQEEKERAEVTLHSIGDAVITASVDSKVEYLNPVAENLTGWRMEEAVGQPLENVFRIVEEVSRQPAVNPVERCLQEGRIVGLANHTILIRRDGREFSVDDSAAPIRNHNLEVVGVVLVFHDVTEERRLSRQVAHDAMHDSLTGLVNRREFEKRLERALMNTKEHKTSHILCYLDLDQFKIVNDTAGHAAGDELLKQVSGLLVGLFRQRDTIARLGGDEFGLLLENCQLEQALIIANEIRAKIRNFPFVWAGHGFQVGVSIGVVPITPEKESVNQLLGQADIACYSAKDLGRDRIYVYHAEDRETTQRHSGILQAARMRDAILNDQFRLFCQPIVHVSEEEGMLQYEVLLRMADRDGELVLPGAFIPPAERYGLMHAIDRWVIRKTLLTLTDHDIQRMLVNINLSGNSLDDETLLEYVLDQLNEFSIPAGHICFEITETAAIHHLSKAQQFIHAFRGRGGRIALDDFGSGFSSFRYLKTLPVDYIKIDGSFVSDMLSNPGDLLMVEAITQIAHTLGIKVIAEHASNIEIISRLREIGVDRAQGFGIGLPVPVKEAWKSKK